MMIILRGAFAKDWTQNNAFDRVKEIRGQEIRNKEGRRTVRFEYNSKFYYLKHHTGIGWGEIVKCLSQLKLPVTGAANEWRAINRLSSLGVKTLTPLAYGLRGANPAKIESFLITEELTGTISLAKYTERWPQYPPTFNSKQKIIETVATISRAIHRDGINHRDLYICHFLLKRQIDLLSGPVMHLVDLHRAQCRSAVPKRWLVKDLASLYFSSLDIGLTRRDIFRFLKIYFNKPLKEIITSDGELLTAVRQRALQLYRRDFGQEPAVIY
ncbi:lipopolysaccharide core heptose(I) kinase RfaP [Aurantivibrio infirmus]